MGGGIDTVEIRLLRRFGTLEAIADRGAAALYTGERARAILATVQGGGGALTADDLATLDQLSARITGPRAADPGWINRTTRTA